jgi:MoaA/NifB/PqqE/SkfB family radical SAM enzyme
MSVVPNTESNGKSVALPLVAPSPAQQPEPNFFRYADVVKEQPEKVDVNRKKRWRVPTLLRRAQQLTHQLKIAMGARTYDKAYTGPLYVQIGLVNACNYRCQFCWDHPSYVDKDNPFPDPIAATYAQEHPDIDTKKAYMSWDMTTRLIDDLHALGTRKIKFIGRGESFLHPNFIDIVEYAKDRDFNVGITTNGSLIKDDDVRRLVACGVNEIFCSVNAASPETYNQVHLHTKPDAFDRVRRTLRLLSDEKIRQGKPGPYLHLSFVIQNSNYFEIPKMVELAHEVGAQRVAFNRISVYDGTQFLMLTPEQNDELEDRILPEAETLAERHGVLTNIELFRARSSDAKRSKEIHSKIPCYIGWYFAIILADGTVNPCCECLRMLGSLKQNSFREIWFSEAYRKFRGEIKDLPNQTEEVSGCRCYNCSFSLHNRSMHRFVHPFSRENGGAGYGVKDLLKFMFR